MKVWVRTGRPESEECASHGLFRAMSRPESPDHESVAVLGHLLLCGAAALGDDPGDLCCRLDRHTSTQGKPLDIWFLGAFAV